MNTHNKYFPGEIRKIIIKKNRLKQVTYVELRGLLKLVEFIYDFINPIVAVAVCAFVGQDRCQDERGVKVMEKYV